MTNLPNVTVTVSMTLQNLTAEMQVTKIPLKLNHPEETLKNSDNCNFSKVSDIGKVLYSIEN